MRSFSTLFLLATISGCSDTYNSYVTNNYYPADENTDTGTVEETDIIDTDVIDTGSDQIECGPYMIRDYLGETYEVESNLAFTLNADSPWGHVGTGYQTVFSVDVTAICGDVSLSNLGFLLSGTDQLESGWISHLADLQADLRMDGDVLISWEPSYENVPADYSAFVVWLGDFTTPVEIPAWQTVTLDFSIAFDDEVEASSADNFTVETAPHVRWHGVENPDTYPGVSALGTLSSPILFYGE